MGGRPGPLRARGYAGGGVQDRAPRQPGADRGNRGGGVRLPGRAAHTRPGARFRQGRRAGAGGNAARAEGALIPQSTIITPNSLEARRIAIEDGEENGPELAECARRIIAGGCEYVLVTGTHENTPQVVNTLYGQAGVVRADTWQRLPGSYHGSGCTLASAIAATIANGLEIGDAVKDAQEYTWQTLKAAFRPGMGQHIPDRLFWAREDELRVKTARIPEGAPRAKCYRRTVRHHAGSRRFHPAVRQG
jgi:hypothetical protein